MILFVYNMYIMLIFLLYFSTSPPSPSAKNSSPRPPKRPSLLRVCGARRTTHGGGRWILPILPTEFPTHQGRIMWVKHGR